jgi:hypothetical protein
MISVHLEGEEADRLHLRVVVREGSGASKHDVTLAKRDLERLGRAGEDAPAFVKRCFEFLLEREPKESILARFDVSVIGRYFPEFEREIAAR